MSEEQNQGLNQDLTTKAKIVKFIDAISDEKYATANKYLQSAVDDTIDNYLKTSKRFSLMKV